MMDAKLYTYLSVLSPKDEKHKLIQKKWSEYSGHKVLLSSAKRKKWKPEIEIVAGRKDKVLSLDVAQGIYGGSNSGFGALMLAISLGFTEIYLLGYDFECTNNETHWHEGYTGQSLETQKLKVEKFKAVFVQFSSIIKEEGISVYNLNPNSTLHCFPKISLEEALK